MGAVFLDLDGTLSNSGPPISAAVAHALRQTGVRVPDAATLLHYIGPPLIETFTALGTPDPEVALAHYRDITPRGLCWMRQFTTVYSRPWTSFDRLGTGFTS